MFFFEQPSPKVFVTKDLKDFLARKAKPAVLLRAPVNSHGPALDHYAYEVIENTLLRNGFEVRDEALYYSIASSVNSLKSYSELASLTQTDLIVEVVNFSDTLKYVTNRVKNKRGRLKLMDDEYSFFGSEIEFKVFLASDNKLVGSFHFDYVPCKHGCPAPSIVMNSIGARLVTSIFFPFLLPVFLLTRPPDDRIRDSFRYEAVASKPQQSLQPKLKGSATKEQYALEVFLINATDQFVKELTN